MRKIKKYSKSFQRKNVQNKWGNQNDCTSGKSGAQKRRRLRSAFGERVCGNAAKGLQGRILRGNLAKRDEMLCKIT